MKTKLGTLFLALAAVAGCNSEDDTASVGGSCNFSSLSSCVDYPSSLLAAQLTALESTCATATGVWSDSACTTTGLVGKCTVTSEGITTTTNYYSTLFDATTAQTACTASSGTFTP